MKLRILAEAEGLESTVAEVAWRHDLHSNQIYSWRRAYAEGRLGRKAAMRASFAAVELVTDHVATSPLADHRSSACVFRSCFEIILKNERRIRIGGDFDGDALRRLVTVLDSV